MALQMYELSGRDERLRFSPYCWRVRYALAHKGLECDFIPWRFTQKEAIAFSGQGKVPVLVDGETTVTDSYEIFRYLDREYPDKPLLGDDGRVPGAFHDVQRTGIGTGMLRTIVGSSMSCIPTTRAYRETREKALSSSRKCTHEQGADGARCRPGAVAWTPGRG